MANLFHDPSFSPAVVTPPPLLVVPSRSGGESPSFGTSSLLDCGSAPRSHALVEARVHVLLPTRWSPDFGRPSPTCRCLGLVGSPLPFVNYIRTDRHGISLDARNTEGFAQVCRCSFLSAESGLLMNRMNYSIHAVAHSIHELNSLNLSLFMS